jgi:hypothetical protein
MHTLFVLSIDTHTFYFHLWSLFNIRCSYSFQKSTVFAFLFLCTELLPLASQFTLLLDFWHTLCVFAHSYPIRLSGSQGGREGFASSKPDTSRGRGRGKAVHPVNQVQAGAEAEEGVERYEACTGQKNTAQNIQRIDLWLASWFV